MLSIIHKNLRIKIGELRNVSIFVGVMVCDMVKLTAYIDCIVFP